MGVCFKGYPEIAELLFKEEHLWTFSTVMEARR